MPERGSGDWRLVVVASLLAALVLGFEFALRAAGLSGAADLAQLVAVIPIIAGLVGWALRHRQPSGADASADVPEGATVRSRGMIGLVVITAAVLVLVFNGGYLIGYENHRTAAPRQTNPNSTGSSATSSPTSVGVRSHSKSAGKPTSSGSGGYLVEYSDKQFTMPGGGCQSASFPSEVAFADSGPDVSTSGNGQYDLELTCTQGADDNGPGIDFSFDQVAKVTGTPGPNACELAITRDPLAANGIVFSALSKGIQYCINTVSGLLARVTLVAANDTTYNLTWTVTAWSPPASG